MMIMLIVSILLLNVFILQGAFRFFILRFLSSLVDYEKMISKKYVVATTDWSQLPKDLLEVVVRRLDRLPDHCRFGGVCKSWRSVAIENRHHLPNQLPLLMVSAGYSNNKEVRRFLRLSHKSNSFFQPFRGCYLQEAKQLQQYGQIPHGHVCCGSDYGWLFLIDEYNFDTKLWNPFSGAVISLPSGTTLQPKHKISNPLKKWESFAKLLGVLKVTFSSNPACQPPPIVLIIHNVGSTIGVGYKASRLAFCRPVDKTWTCLHSPSPSPLDENNPFRKHISFEYGIYISFMDAIYYKDQFYVLLHPGLILAYDIGGWYHADDDDEDSSVIKVTKIASAPKGFIPKIGLMYLVEVEGKLVIVSRKIRISCTQREEDPCNDFYSIYDDGSTAASTAAVYDADDYWDREEIDMLKIESLVARNHRSSVYETIGFDLLRFDEAIGGQKEWVKVKSLGDNVLFLGNNTSFACSTTTTSYDCILEATNSIFFTDGRGHERTLLRPDRYDDLGIYKLMNGSIDKLSYTVGSSSHRLGMPPPIWVTCSPWFKIDNRTNSLQKRKVSSSVC